MNKSLKKLIGSTFVITAMLGATVNAASAPVSVTILTK